MRKARKVKGGKRRKVAGMISTASKPLSSELMEARAKVDAQMAGVPKDTQALVIGADEEQMAALARGSCVVLSHPLEFVCPVGAGLIQDVKLFRVRSVAIEKGRLLVSVGGQK